MALAISGAREVISADDNEQRETFNRFALTVAIIHLLTSSFNRKVFRAKMSLWLLCSRTEDNFPFPPLAAFENNFTAGKASPGERGARINCSRERANERQRR